MRRKACSSVVVLTCILLCTTSVFAQNGKAKQAAEDPTDPFKGMPFKSGDTVTQKVVMNIGSIPIRGTIKFVIDSDDDGMFYGFRHTYRVSVLQLKVDRVATKGVPADLIEQLEATDHAELAGKDIVKDVFPYESDDYLFSIHDFNMDGKDDFALVADQGFHSNYVLYYIWVNINNKLVKWTRLSDNFVDEKDVKKRTLCTLKFDDGSPKVKCYRVIKDTTLIPIKVIE